MGVGLVHTYLGTRVHRVHAKWYINKYIHTLGNLNFQVCFRFGIQVWRTGKFTVSLPFSGFFVFFSGFGGLVDVFSTRHFHAQKT